MEGKITTEIKRIDSAGPGKPNMVISAEASIEKYDQALAGAIISTCCHALGLEGKERTVILLAVIAGLCDPASSKSVGVAIPGKRDYNE